MRAVIPFLLISLAFLVLCGCAARQLPSLPPSVSAETLRADELLPGEGFAPGWKAVPGSYIYSPTPDELWKIYDGAAPGIVNQGGREAATQAYEKTQDGADRSLRVFILRFVDTPHALAYLKKEMGGAQRGERLSGVEAGQIFDKGKAPWVRFVVGCYLVSINWEGSDDDTENAALDAVRAIAAKLPSSQSSPLRASYRMDPRRFNSDPRVGEEPASASYGAGYPLSR